jgi:tRNA threonylcarbamoyladenosine biosynthesis protein TsaE
MPVVCDQADTEALAAAVATQLRPGDAVLLEGPLGAGKTTFARALIRAACAAPMMDVPSPSYTLVQTYEAGRLRIHHFDLWRLEGPDSLADLGWDDALADVVIVEWPDRLQGLWPQPALLLRFAPVDETRRAITVIACDGRPIPLPGRTYAGATEHGTD